MAPHNGGMTTIGALDEGLSRLAHAEGVLVQVCETKGSAPREVGAWMVVWPDGLTGTIGGGNLEFDAVAQARTMLQGHPGAPTHGEVRRFALGPSLGQCCGGIVMLRFERVRAADAEALRQRLSLHLSPVALFGGGHVGHAIVRVLCTLPYAVRWIDSRDEVFPATLPAPVRTEYSDPVQAAVDELAPGSRVLIMSFSHAEDLDIVIACLERLRERDDLPYIGLIGSKTKWATFRHRLSARGFSESEQARITCPIGIPGIAGKQPEVIAVAVAAQLLLQAPPHSGT